ncbi:unnamed protein product [Linum trigynum]|uniref:Uncharacterized protein n=1 Tax=Linum trigynum TaxID=586398 RepID=A0AAV2CW01_9ROSI
MMHGKVPIIMIYGKTTIFHLPFSSFQISFHQNPPPASSHWSKPSLGRSTLCRPTSISGPTYRCLPSADPLPSLRSPRLSSPGTSPSSLHAAGNHQYDLDDSVSNVEHMEDGGAAVNVKPIGDAEEHQNNLSKDLYACPVNFSHPTMYQYTGILYN